MGLREKLGQEFVLTTELGGTNGTDVAKSLEDARAYHHLDALNTIDCASGRLRMNAFVVGCLVQRELGIEVIPHLTCRDRSILGLQADLLGAHALGLRSVLATTGDPPSAGPYPSKAVYDVNSVRLIKMIADLNNGLDYNGDQINGHTDFLIAAVAAPAAPNLDAVARNVERKKAAGAHFIQTQPIFDVAQTRAFLEKVRPLGIPILVGVMPLRGLKMAEYMNKEVEGVNIPHPVIERIKGGTSGIQIAQEFVEELHGEVDGFHIMSMGNMKATNEIIDHLGKLRNLG